MSRSNSPINFLTLPNVPCVLAILENNLIFFKNALRALTLEEINLSLWVAAGLKKTIIVRFLLENGADPNAATEICIIHRYPLQIAVATPNNLDCILLLLEFNADIHVKAIGNRSLTQLCHDTINNKFLHAHYFFYTAIDEFDEQQPYPNLAFYSSLLASPQFVFDMLAKMVEASIAIARDIREEDAYYHPRFLQFAIRQLILLAETKPYQFLQGWLTDEFMNLAMHLNAYEIIPQPNPYALFKSKEEKMKMLYFYELRTPFAETKRKCKDSYQPN